MTRESGISRRSALRLVGGTVAASSLTGLVAGEDGGQSDGDDGRVRVNVGYNARSGRQAAADRAEEVYYDHPTDVLTVEVDRNAVPGLRQRSDVRFVEADIELEAIAQTTPYGIEKVNATDAHAAGETGDGADVAVIDTGIDRDHPDLAANIGEGRAFIAGLGTNQWDDDNGHGTHCAGTVGAIDNDEGVVGVAPDVMLHAVKVLTATGTGLTSDIAAGIEWAADQGYDVGSLSLGGGGSNTLREACQHAESKGTLLVAAAGNDGPCSDCVSAPARYPECMAVSATDENDDLASFSSTGPEIEIAAPGADVYSTYLGGGYQTLSGTSMACPHVSGGAAQLAANGYSMSEIRQQLKDTADDVGLATNEQGAGRLDVADALGL
jgi:subtilisin